MIFCLLPWRIKRRPHCWSSYKDYLKDELTWICTTITRICSQLSSVDEVCDFYVHQKLPLWGSMNENTTHQKKHQSLINYSVIFNTSRHESKEKEWDKNTMSIEKNLMAIKNHAARQKKVSNDVDWKKFVVPCTMPRLIDELGSTKSFVQSVHLLKCKKFERSRYKGDAIFFFFFFFNSMIMLSTRTSKYPVSKSQNFAKKK